MRSIAYLPEKIVTMRLHLKLRDETFHSYTSLIDQRDRNVLFICTMHQKLRSNCPVKTKALIKFTPSRFAI